jgi:processive 1,2-diacylglycerol beta-glucosyltransferase
LSSGLQRIIGAVDNTAHDAAARCAPATRAKQATRVAGAPPHAEEVESPILILTIDNGAGHTRTAQAIAEAISLEGFAPSAVVDVADHMNALTRFTHVTAYLWLVCHAPAVWERVDRYQKRQTHTSPEWYYRRGCRRLFDLAREMRPRAIVATEVGCCEIAALIKRDLGWDVPLVAVNVDYDADRAWVQREVDLYTVMTDGFAAELARLGAPLDRLEVWGAPLSADFSTVRGFEDSRARVCRWLDLDERRPLVLMTGGGEGLGQIEASLARLVALDEATQLIVLAGRNAALKSGCERVIERARAQARVRVLGWVDEMPMPRLMRASDVLVSKLGNTFSEAMACELPLVALLPPPGSERAQYQLLDELGTGRAVRTLEEMTETVRALLADDAACARIRERCRVHRRTDAAQRIARWLAARAATSIMCDGVLAHHDDSPAALAVSNDG